MKGPVILESRNPNPEAMQFLGGKADAMAIVAWLTSRNVPAEYKPTHLANGKNGLQWEPEAIHINVPKQGFRRTASPTAWILVDDHGVVTVISNAVKERMWRLK